MVGREKKSTADAEILIFKIEKNIDRHVAMVGRENKSTADAQIFIFKLGNNIYRQMKSR